VLHTSHRVVVLRDRHMVAERAAAVLDEAGVLHIIAGHDAAQPAHATA
jgi:ABC-type sugar transport system ATPase subunit